MMNSERGSEGNGMGKLHILAIDGWHLGTFHWLIDCHWGERSRLKRSDREAIGLGARLAAILPTTSKWRVSPVLIFASRQWAGDTDGPWKSILDALVHADCCATTTARV